jgi:hypothetical protein
VFEGINIGVAHRFLQESYRIRPYPLPLKGDIWRHLPSRIIEKRSYAQQSFQPFVEPGVAESKLFMEDVITQKARAHRSHLRKQFVQINFLDRKGIRKVK